MLANYFFDTAKFLLIDLPLMGFAFWLNSADLKLMRRQIIDF